MYSRKRNEWLSFILVSTFFKSSNLSHAIPIQFLTAISRSSLNRIEFLSHSIQSKYYKPEEIITAETSKDAFSMLHLNITLQAHLPDLTGLLVLSNNPFRVI